MKVSQPENYRHGELSFVRRSSFAKRIGTFFLNYKSISTTNWIDKLAEVYGNFACIHLDTPLEYPFLSARHLGYRDMVEFINRAGNALRSVGVKKGDRVVLVPSNRIELGLLNFACQKIEAVPAPLNYMYRGQEIRRIIEDLGAEVLITDMQVFDQSIRDSSDFPTLRECLVLENDPPPGCKSLGSIMSEVAPDLEPGAGRNPKKAVQIFYSSGTTGFPKGALITRLGYFYFIRSFLGLGALSFGKRRDLLVTSLPLAHVMGMTLLIARLATSTPWYFINRFDPEYILECIQKKRATSFIGVPAMYSMIMSKEPEKYNLRSILLWGSAADAMAPELLEKVIRLRPGKYPFPLFVEIYGQVETGGPTSIRLGSARGMKRSKARMFPVPGVKVRVVNESGMPVKRGEVGELLVRGPLVTSGYWNRPEANEKAFYNGWFRTGDLVRRGWIGFEFAGRKSERIKRGGYSVFPQEVEEELLFHPEIVEAAVLGIPDPVKGQVPVAAVVARQGSSITEKELMEWARQNIAAFKCPRIIMILPELPRGATQKVLKKQIVEMALQKTTGG